MFCPRHWQDGGPTGHCSYAALIAGYLGSARLMDDAVTEFAVDYADQNQRDYRVFVRAIRHGRLKAQIEE